MTDAPKEGPPRLPDMARTVAAVTTPYGLLALLVLAVAPVLVAVTRGLGDDVSRLRALYGLLVLFALVAAGGLLLAGRIEGRAKTGAGPGDAASATPAQRPFGKQVTFMSAPMASLSATDYRLMKDKMGAVKSKLRDVAGQAEVYWGGDAVSDPVWDRPADALAQTLQRIRACDNFVMILPDYSCRPVDGAYCKPSSIWWEAGMAMAFHKRCAFFVHRSIEDRARIPYYLRAMQTADQPDVIPRARLWPFDRVDDILRDIEDAGTGLFGG